MTQAAIDWVVERYQSFDGDYTVELEDGAWRARHGGESLGEDFATATEAKEACENHEAITAALRAARAEEARIGVREIEALRIEARRAGDHEQVSQCTLALQGDKRAMLACIQAIQDARAMED